MPNKKDLHTSQCEFITLDFPARARELTPKHPEKSEVCGRARPYLNAELHYPEPNQLFGVLGLHFTNVVGWFKKSEDQWILPRVQSVVDLFHCKGHPFSGCIKT